MGDITKPTENGFVIEIDSRSASGIDNRILYAFDFDHTILDGNSDTEIMKLLPEGVPPSVRGIYDGCNWTAFMDAVFQHMTDKGISEQQLREFVRTMPSTPGMDILLKEICSKKSPDSRLLVLSDSNDIFIPEYLSHVEVKADDVITNIATVTPEGRLKLDPYENQETCPICPRNLCKGTALSKYISEQEKVGKPFSQVVYVGDGRNDACPATRLRERDIVFVRKGFPLEKILNEGLKVRSQEIQIKAHIVVWDHGDVIREMLFK